ncbi:hypothetical protein M0R01_04535 [bacterium]|nr:hypothetical protein [bacterium]
MKGKNNIYIGEEVGWEDLPIESYQFVIRLGKKEFRTIMSPKEHKIILKVINRLKIKIIK